MLNRTNVLAINAIFRDHICIFAKTKIQKIDNSLTDLSRMCEKKLLSPKGNDKKDT